MSLATIRTDDSTTEPDRPAVRAPRFTASLADGLGDRVLMHDGLSTSLELLRFKREFSDSTAFEAALRERTALVRTLEHPSIAPIRSVDRRGTYDGLTLSSSVLEGRRLSEMLKAARGSAFALDFLGQVGPALVALQDLGPDVVHGALTVDRVVVAREGRLVVTEHVLGSALTALGLSPARLRAEIGVAVPDGDGPAVIDARLDVIQLGFIALSLLVGRRLDASDFPAKIGAHLDAFANDDAAAAARLRPWLERALQQGEHPFANAREAHAAFVTLADAVAPQPRPAVPVTATPSSERPLHERPAVSRTPARAAEPAAPLPPKPSPVAIPAVSARSRGWLTAALGIAAGAEALVIGGLIYMWPISIAGVAGEFPRPESTAGAAVVTAISEPVITVDAGLTGGPAPQAASVPVIPEIDPAVRAAAKEPALPAGAQVGGITVSSPIDLVVMEGGRAIGTSGGSIALPDGAHTFELINEELGFRSRHTVDVKPGRMITVNVAAPNGRVSINAAPWADVWIDGNAAGQTPLANLVLPIGRHNVLFRHPQFGEQRQDVIVKVDGLARVSAVFQK